MDIGNIDHSSYIQKHMCNGTLILQMSKSRSVYVVNIKADFSLT